MATQPPNLQDASGDDDRFVLRCGASMTQPQFHESYSSMPEGYIAELIGGKVYEPSPVGLDHGKFHANISAVFLAYAGRTQGLEIGGNATVILSDEDEVQPDLFLRILPEFGGQSKNAVERSRVSKQRGAGAQYIHGAPELIAEVAHSSRAPSASSIRSFPSSRLMEANMTMSRFKTSVSMLKAFPRGETQCPL